MNKIDEQTEKILGKIIYVLSSNNDKHFMIRKLHLKDLNHFYNKWNEKIYAVNENLEELIKYADNIITNFLNANDLEFKKNKFYVLDFDMDYFIGYIQFYYDNKKEKISRYISYR